MELECKEVLELEQAMELGCKSARGLAIGISCTRVMNNN